MTGTTTGPVALLAGWVARQASPAGRAWLEAGVAQIPTLDERVQTALLGMAARNLGRDALALDGADLAAADRSRPGWRPAGLTLADAGRLVLLASSHGGNGAALAARLLFLCRTGDLGEVIGYYRGLPILPEPQELLPVAHEGVRSAMQPVFDAVALHSPFPAEMFDEDSWNQLVLKSLFIGSSLLSIQGLDDRANPRLATTLVDYAHERWSAGRPVSPELWRCVGRFAGDYEMAALRRATESDDPAERDAARACIPAHRSRPRTVSSLA